MAHQNSNRIIIEKGTEVNTGNATFLVKSGSSNETLEASVDDAVITNGGVLIQVMDNDDASLGHFGSGKEIFRGNSKRNPPVKSRRI